MYESMESTSSTSSQPIGNVVLPTGPMTAEQYGRLPDLGFPSELVRGQIKLTRFPDSEHGQICATFGSLLRNFVRERNLGRTVSNNSGVITQRQPDSVRGPDIAYYSFQRVSPGRLRERRYLDVGPELVIEVKSEFDWWSEMNEKIAEYLKAGVLVVCAVDPDTDSVQVHYPDRPMRVVNRDEELLLPEVLPDFRVAVREFFE